MIFPEEHQVKIYQNISDRNVERLCKQEFIQKISGRVFAPFLEKEIEEDFFWNLFYII